MLSLELSDFSGKCAQLSGDPRDINALRSIVFVVEKETQLGI